jgi:hypothetical protein
MSAATFDVAAGRLEASEDEVAALIALDGSAEPPSEHIDALARAGAVTDDGPHEALRDALDAIRSPLCELGLERGERSGRGWVSAYVAVLLVPAPDGRVVLHQVPPAFLPDALARMNDLSPRPRVEPAVRLRYAPGALAQILAGAEEAAEPAARMLADTLREHWRVEASWAPARNSPGVRALEVLDTGAGIWLVIPDDPSVELWPTTPTMVFRLLTGLLPRDHELATRE